MKDRADMTVPAQKPTYAPKPELRVRMIDWLNFIVTSVAAVATVLAVVVAVRIAQRAFADSRQNLVLARASFDEARNHQLLNDLFQIGQIVSETVSEMHPYWKSSPVVPISLDAFAEEFNAAGGRPDAIGEAHYWVQAEQRVHLAIENFRNACTRSRIALGILEREWNAASEAAGRDATVVAASTRAALAAEAMRDELAWLDACLMANYHALVAPHSLSPQHPGPVAVLKLIWDRYDQSPHRGAGGTGLDRVRDAARWAASNPAAQKFAWPAAGVSDGIEVHFDPNELPAVFANSLLDEARSGQGSFYSAFERLAIAASDVRAAEAEILQRLHNKSLLTNR